MSITNKKTSIFFKLIIRVSLQIEYFCIIYLQFVKNHYDINDHLILLLYAMYTETQITLTDDDVNQYWGIFYCGSKSKKQTKVYILG